MIERGGKSVPDSERWHAQAARYGLLSEVVLLIAGTPDLDRLLSLVVGKLKWVLDFDRCTLALKSEGGTSYELRTLLESRPDVEPISLPSVPINKGRPGRVLASGRIEDTASESGQVIFDVVDPGMESSGLRHVMALPLHAYDQTLGCITFGTTRELEYQLEDVKVAREVAVHLALAIDRWRQSEAIKNANAQLRLEIVEREKAQRELAKSNERAAAAHQRLIDALEGTQEGFSLFDSNDRLVLCNRRFRELYPGISDMMKIGTSFEAIIRSAAERDLVRDALGRQDEWLSERIDQHRNPRGPHLQALIGGQWMQINERRTEDGGTVAVYTDITALKQAQEAAETSRMDAVRSLTALKEAQASLVHAEKMASLGQLTAGIAHEIKNPLNFINNFAETSIELLGELSEIIIAIDKPVDEETRQQVEGLMSDLTSDLATIAQHGRRADGIVKSMLLHARGQAGDWLEVDVNELVGEALNLAYHGERAHNSSFNIKLIQEFDPETGSCKLVPQEITRVLLNLFSNAFHATKLRREKGKSADFAPALSVTTCPLDEKVEIRVQDNGIGMSKDVLGKIFTPFYTTKPSGEGTGLGLSLSYDIVVQHHQGTFEVDSKPEAYTEFTVRLPRQPIGNGLAHSVRKLS